MDSILLRGSEQLIDFDSWDTEVVQLGPEDPTALWRWKLHPDFLLASLHTTGTYLVEWRTNGGRTLSSLASAEVNPTCNGWVFDTRDFIVNPAGSRGFSLFRGPTVTCEISDTETTRLGLEAVRSTDIATAPAEAIADFRSWATDAIATADGVPELADAQRLVNGLLTCGGSDAGDTQRAALMRRAIAFVADNDPVSTEQIWAGLDVSRSALYRAFSEVLGLSPKQWVTIRRLNRVRTEIRRNLTPVVDTAEMHGFHHHGSFSSSYRRLFGELPRDTLAKARARRTDEPSRS